DGAAALQVLKCQLEARAQVLQLGDDLQPLVGGLGVRPGWVVEEVRIGSLPGAAHPAAQLVELGQSQPLRIHHHDGIGVGDVQAGLDDGGAHKDVGLAYDDVHQHLGQV